MVLKFLYGRAELDKQTFKNVNVIFDTDLRRNNLYDLFVPILWIIISGVLLAPQAHQSAKLFCHLCLISGRFNIAPRIIMMFCALRRIYVLQTSQSLLSTRSLSLAPFSNNIVIRVDVNQDAPSK